MSEQNLKPCPFCGGEAIVRKERYVTIEEKWIVECNSPTCVCKPKTIVYPSQESAVNAWNRRSNDEQADC